MNKGKLILMPMLLGSEKWEVVIPFDVRNIAINTRYFAVENIKTARRYLRKLDSDFPIDTSTFFILNKKTPTQELSKMIAPLLAGSDVAIISEAGCPGIADPGSNLVALAHKRGCFVTPLTGPSSILLSLIGSGFNGQSFTFHGYIPKDRKDRIQKLKEWERIVHKTGATQIFMDTPFRNNNLLEDILNECTDNSYLCIACDLTMATERIQTMSISQWRVNAFSLDKRPTMFLLGKPSFL